MDSSPPTLTLRLLRKAVGELAAADPDLGRIFDNFGYPPLWEREPGFATVVHVVLEQQVSLASARAAMDKLESALETVSPERFLPLSDSELKSIGFSSQKMSYCRGLAEVVLEQPSFFTDLEVLSDDSVYEKLTSLRGIGRWTAGVYLLMVLRRPDSWPTGDRALAVAASEVKGLSEVPDYETLDGLAEQWRPWRSVAARLLWHHYLNTPRRK